MKKHLFTLLAIVAVCGLMAQTAKTITFTSILDNGTFARLTGVTIKNLTKNWTQHIEYPDTTLTMSNITGISESRAGNVVLTQNSPNPFCGHTRVTLQLPADEDVNTVLYDMNGKVYAHRQMRLYAGTYSLNISGMRHRYIYCR